jgi:hypothetical protein
MKTRFHKKSFGYKNINFQTVIMSKAFAIGQMVKCHKSLLKANGKTIKTNLKLIYFFFFFLIKTHQCFNVKHQNIFENGKNIVTTIPHMLPTLEYKEIESINQSR